MRHLLTNLCIRLKFWFSSLLQAALWWDWAAWQVSLPLLRLAEPAVRQTINLMWIETQWQAMDTPGAMARRSSTLSRSFSFASHAYLIEIIEATRWCHKLMESTTCHRQQKKKTYSQFSTHIIMHTSVNSTCSFLWKHWQKNFYESGFFLLSSHSWQCNVWLNI